MVFRQTAHGGPRGGYCSWAQFTAHRGMPWPLGLVEAGGCIVLPRAVVEVLQLFLGNRLPRWLFMGVCA